MWRIFILLVVVSASMTAAYETFIDVSHWQGDIDWQRVRAAGIRRAVAKATDGHCYQDPKFLTNWKEMKNNNITPSAYHYFRGGDSATSQAINVRFVLQSCGFDFNSDILAIDVEQTGNVGVSPDKMADTLHELLVNLGETIKNIYIYTGYYFWNDNVSWNKYDFSVYNLWIARWSSDAPMIPSTWAARGYTWWQYSSKGRVDGITGDVDMDRTK